MQLPFRHQCLIYEGAPSRQLPALAAVVRQMLAAQYRCLYLNSPVMVAGMSSYLAAKGIDVAHEVSKTNLVFSSDQSHLSDGGFDVDEMISKLDDAIIQALTDGYKGLWVTGDMSWEFGTERNFSKLLKYERQLEELFRRQPMLSGICQYHCDLLPHEVLRQGLLTHRAVFISETLSRVNPHFAVTESILDETMNVELDEMITKLRGEGCPS
jgi:MEDS: MEthanogen/methylotroph, DcmR Sensory domain